MKLSGINWTQPVFGSQLAAVTGDEPLVSVLSVTPRGWAPACKPPGTDAAPWWESMYSVNTAANGSESLINLVLWRYHFLQLTLARLQDGKPGWREKGKKPLMIYELVQPSAP